MAQDRWDESRDTVPTVDPMADTFAAFLEWVRALPEAERPAAEQYSSLAEKIEESSGAWVRRATVGGLMAVTACGTCTLDINESFLRGMRVCAAALWETAFYHPSDHE